MPSNISINHSHTLSSSIKFQCCLRVSETLFCKVQSISLAMLKHFQSGSWTMLVYFPPTLPCYSHPKVTSFETESRCSGACSAFKAFSNVFKPGVYSSTTRCAARRRVRYDVDEDDGDEDEEEEHNKEIALLELYSQSVRGEALIVHAMVDDQPVEVLIFKVCAYCQFLIIYLST